jgi:hypothetical protein
MTVPFKFCELQDHTGQVKHGQDHTGQVKHGQEL